MYTYVNIYICVYIYTVYMYVYELFDFRYSVQSNLQYIVT